MIFKVLACLLCHQTSGNLYDAYVKKLRSASTVSGRVVTTVTTPHNTTRATDIFKLELPNRLRIETWLGKQLAELMVDDGKTLWDYTASPKYLTKQTGSSQFILGGGYLIEPFLNQSLANPAPEFLATSSRPTRTKFHGRPAVKVEISRTKKPGVTTSGEVYMDPKTGLPIDIVLHPSDTRTVEYSFEDLKIGKTIDPVAFKYEAPIAANANQMDDLLPVGSKAPWFKGVALGEKPFDMASSMKGAKAVILNFWGLGCPGCLAELPKLQDLQNRFAAKGLRVVTFQPLDDMKILSSRLKMAHVNLTTVFEGSCKPLAVDQAYRGAIGEPVTYLINEKGTIVAHYMSDDVTQLTKDLAALGLKD